ncbi:MAG: 23S rRNA pseudouridine(2605) synthase RluB [Arsenophonus sp.]
MLKSKKSEKLQKILAHLGYGSRRKIESLIQSGMITVDGKLTILGERIKIKYKTKICLGGNLLKIKKDEKTSCRMLAYYKPEGLMCTNHDPEGRHTVFEHLPKLTGYRWISIGRLDVNTSGLLLFTTDGELANRLMHPSYEVEREYLVRIFGKIDNYKIYKLTKGIQLKDSKSKFKSFEFRSGKGMNKWFTVILTEGHNREIRRLCGAVGIQVNRLIRIRYGNIYLPKRLRKKEWVELNLSQINYLRKLVDLIDTRSSKL